MKWERTWLTSWRMTWPNHKLKLEGWGVGWMLKKLHGHCKPLCCPMDYWFLPSESCLVLRKPIEQGVLCWSKTGLHGSNTLMLKDFPFLCCCCWISRQLHCEVFQSSPHSNGKGQHLGGGTKSNNNWQPLGGRNSFQLLKCPQSCSWKELNLCQDLSESRVDLFLVSKQGCRPTNTLIAALYNPKHGDPVKQCPYS